jgi:hypothetical protein
MRRYLFVVPLLIACSKAETPPADSAAAAAPAALTDADVSGTWTGTLMAEGSDSVLFHWTDVCGAGTCRLTSQEAPKDTVTATYVLQGDSAIGTVAAHPDPTMAGTMVTEGWVARISGNQVTGTGHVNLASKPDSVLLRYRFTGTKAP